MATYISTERKFLTANNIRLAYVDERSELKKAIVFIHGNSCSTEIWHKQFNDPIFSHFRMISFDLPAHGLSEASASSENEYSVIALGRIMAEAVKRVVVDSPYVLVGFSLGSNIVSEMLPFISKPAGIVLVSSSVLGENHKMEKVFRKNEYLPMYFNEIHDIKFVKEGIKEGCLSTDENDRTLILDSYLQVHPRFRAALGETAQSNLYSDEINLIIDSKLSPLVIFGKQCRFIDVNYLDEVPIPFWKKIYKIEDAGHYVQIDQSDQFNKILAEYANDRFALSAK